MPVFNEARAEYERRIRERFPRKEILTISDASKFCGVDFKTVKKIIKFNNNYVTVVNFAKQLSNI